MAFFNLTHTGVQDPFKTASYGKEDESKHTESSTEVEQERDTDSKDQSLEPQVSPSSVPTPSHVQTMYSSSETGETGRTWHRGSHCLYTEHLKKHRRHLQGPMELYQRPLTTSTEYGWWLKDGSPHREEWTQSERHAHVNSEMTRFVDDMSLTNKEFSLY